ncbi:MAG TPA: hypothetical protein VER33_19825 [Polyangiaceae bacterium]|nr:hypothetical protein [Polyangiaceae bacterium]
MAARPYIQPARRFAGRLPGGGPLFSRWAALVACLSFIACQPQIGDECSTSVDCSASGERLCDITQPGGYCTVPHCEPGTCPDDSVCIAFGAQVSPAAGCADATGLSRFQRSFCMASCDSSKDCRPGYECSDVGVQGNAWSAVVIDARDSGKVCVVPSTASPVPQDRPHQVCEVSSSSSGSAGTGTGGSGG